MSRSVQAHYHYHSSAGLALVSSSRIERQSTKQSSRPRLQPESSYLFPAAPQTIYRHSDIWRTAHAMFQPSKLLHWANERGRLQSMHYLQCTPGSPGYLHTRSEHAQSPSLLVRLAPDLDLPTLSLCGSYQRDSLGIHEEVRHTV